MSPRAGWTAALAAMTAALAACGGAAQSRLSRGPRAALLAPGVRRADAPAGARSSGLGGPPSPYRVALPSSPRGATTCTVYEPGYGTQIIVDSGSLDVKAECELWASGQPGDGYLFGYEGGAVLPDGTQFCSFADPSRKLTASVIEQTGFVAVSAAERSRALSACASILASGWRARSGRPRP